MKCFRGGGGGGGGGWEDEVRGPCGVYQIPVPSLNLAQIPVTISEIQFPVIIFMANIETRILSQSRIKAKYNNFLEPFYQ